MCVCLNMCTMMTDMFQNGRESYEEVSFLCVYNTLHEPEREWKQRGQLNLKPYTSWI